MTPRTRRSKRVVRLAVFLVVATVASGCGPLLTLYATRHANDGRNDTTKFDPDRDVFLREMAKRFGLMALFAEVVYRRDLPAETRDALGCAYLDGGDPAVTHPRFGMPEGADGGGRWMRWVPSRGEPSTLACVDEKGLHYEVFVYEAAGRVEEAVIAFRGTENRAGQYWNDWSANVVAALGFEPGQYVLARRHVPATIEALKARFAADGRPLPIYVTGHSLGGGLAQQAGYLSKDVLEVFTFDTSPVTNWTWLRLHEEVGNAYPVIHRLYHGGEFLEQVRFVATTFSAARYGRHDIGLQLEGRRTFEGHSMKIIACNFATFLAAPPHAVEPDHHYPLAYVRDVVLARRAPAGDKRLLICPDEDVDP